MIAQLKHLAFFTFTAFASLANAQEIPSIELIHIHGGTLQLGSTDAVAEDDEKIQMNTEVGDFYLAKYEVTQALWMAIMGNNPSTYRNCPECPVETVSWEDAQAFIHALNEKTGENYRLPTEAEWDFAAKGGTQSQGHKYSGSPQLDEVAWHDQNSEGRPHEVGQKKPNELGLYDMSGNVYEWCADWYSPTYEYHADVNPHGPTEGVFRVLRGGDYTCPAAFCRIANRRSFLPSTRMNFNGLRLAKDVEAPN